MLVSILKISIHNFILEAIMKLAVVGSRGIFTIDLEKYVIGVDEIVSGGAKGVDLCAADFARSHNIKLTEFVPEYSRFGRAAPLVRNKQIVEYADKVLVFWDGSSKGTKFVIDYAEKITKTCDVIIIKRKPSP